MLYMVLYASHPTTQPTGTCTYTVLSRRRAKPLQITHSIISHIYLVFIYYLSLSLTIQLRYECTSHSLHLFDVMCVNSKNAPGWRSQSPGRPQVAICTLIHIQLEKLPPSLATGQPGVQALQDKFERIFNSSILPMEELISEMSQTLTKFV